MRAVSFLSFDRADAREDVAVSEEPVVPHRVRRLVRLDEIEPPAEVSGYGVLGAPLFVAVEKHPGAFPFGLSDPPRTVLDTLSIGSSRREPGLGEG